MSIELCAMTVQDYDQLRDLWYRCEGLSQSDTRSQLEQLLHDHPQLSCVARHEEEIVAAILAGHDGRRGYLYHLAVEEKWRKQGLARQLVDHCLERLADIGIPRCTVFVYQENEAASQFWERLGWRQRAELKVFARDLETTNGKQTHE